MLPLSTLMPSTWPKTGGTTTVNDGSINAGTRTFDATTCVFTWAHTTCGQTWTFDLPNNACHLDRFGRSSDNPCLFTCPVDCTFIRK
jgi:hypothetical protein